MSTTVRPPRVRMGAWLRTPQPKGVPRHDVGADKLWAGMSPPEVLASLIAQKASA